LALRPYPQYLNIVNNSSPNGNSTYNALQVKLTKRLSHGLTMQGAYTWAKSLTDGSIAAGGGPAGMMLGYLLGRAGIDVVVLEKHADFFRDFRGDTVHPSTLQVMDELGLIDGFLALPHQRIQKMDGLFGGSPVRIADLSRLRVKYPFIAFMPQWDFLNFLRESGTRFTWTLD
jgi:hypothetical protein